MKLLFLLVITIAFCQAEDIKAFYLNCYDGDTCTVDLDNPGGYIPKIFAESMSVRLNGIDTPEMQGGCDQSRCLAKMARDYLINLISKSQYLILHNVKKDKYFRLNSRIWYMCGNNWCDASQALIDQDLAVKYDGTTKVVDWCSESSSMPFYKNAQKCSDQQDFVYYFIWTLLSVVLIATMICFAFKIF